MTLNISEEQVKALAEQTNLEASEKIRVLGQEAGLGIVKQVLLYEVARVAGTLASLSCLLENGRHKDDPTISKVAQSLNNCVTNVGRAGVLGLVNDKDLAAVLAGPERLTNLVEQASKIMTESIVATIRSGIDGARAVDQAREQSK